MATDKVTITIKGGAPWGFRLFGGESLPLTIARLRRKSKAQDSGLQEGDSLLLINGYSCNNMSHATAMALVDSSGQSLTMTVLRGNPDKAAIDAAYHTLGPSKAVPAHLLNAQPRSKTYSPNAELELQESLDSLSHQINGTFNGPDQVQRSEETFHHGDSTTHVKTETQQQQFGSTTLTKVSREEVTTSGGGAGGWESPLSQRRRLQQEQEDQSMNMFDFKRFGSNISVAKPGVWHPGGGGAPPHHVSAPDGINVQHHADKSVTMTLNLSPSAPQQPQVPPGRYVPSFSVSNVSKVTSQPKGVWAPGLGADMRQPSPRRSPVPPLKIASPEPELEQFYDAYDHFDTSARDSPITRIPKNPPLIEPLNLSELIKGESFDDDDVYSPTRKSFYNKKIYSDSSFYDDPEAKYPTIEEQIKMARKVALSLIAPANEAARGHKMFMKRVHKSDRWVAGSGEGGPVFMEDHEPEEVYYRPDPWKSGGHTWEPKSSAPVPIKAPPKVAPASQLSPLATHSYPQERAPVQPMSPPQHSLILKNPAPAITSSHKLSTNPAYKASIPKPFKPFTSNNVPAAYEEPKPAPSFNPAAEFNSYDEPEAPVAPPPPPPPVPTLSMWDPSPSSTARPRSFYDDDKENQRRILGNDVGGPGKKNMHNMVSPQVCFSLSDDLRNMKGKGGKLFAKRRARADQWVVAEKPDLAGPNKDMMAKLLSQASQAAALSNSSPDTPVKDTYDFPSPPATGGAPRLQNMIKSTKSTVSPWEAACQSQSGDIEKAFDHLNRYHTLPLRGKKGGGNHPFAGVASDLTAPSAASSFSPASRPDNYNTKVKPWRLSGNFDQVDYNNFGPSKSSAPVVSGGGYRPVSFKSPSGSFGTFSGTAAPSAHRSVPVGGAVDGYSDL